MSLGPVSILGGTGHQGSGLAQRLAKAGLRVVVGSRDPRRARETVAAWSPAVDVSDNGSAAAGADTIVLAVPFDTVDAIVDEIGGRIREGAVVIDVTVPLTFAGGRMAFVDVPEGSAAEHIRARLPPSALLACAFKTIPAHLLGDVDLPLDCDEFVCADSEPARERALALVAALPRLRGVDVGPLARARSIEHLTALAVAINRRHKRHDARFRVVGL